MTIINGFEIALSEPQLDKMINEQMMPIELINTDFIGYQNLAEGDKKALTHLVKAAKMLNDVALEQDHPLNMSLKKGLEEAGKKVIVINDTETEMHVNNTLPKEIVLVIQRNTVTIEEMINEKSLYEAAGLELLGIVFVE